jgi:hypothetical protein
MKFKNKLITLAVIAFLQGCGGEIHLLHLGNRKSLKSL